MLHENLTHAVAVEGDFSREKLIKDDSESINVDAARVRAGTDLRRHVVHRADAHCLSAVTREIDVLGESVVTNLDDAVLEEEVLRLEVAVHDSDLV